MSISMSVLFYYSNYKYYKDVYVHDYSFWATV